MKDAIRFLIVFTIFIGIFFILETTPWTRNNRFNSLFILLMFAFPFVGYYVVAMRLPQFRKMSSVMRNFMSIGISILFAIPTFAAMIFCMGLYAGPR
jgi:hypothetical protein